MCELKGNCLPLFARWGRSFVRLKINPRIRQQNAEIAPVVAFALSPSACGFTSGGRQPLPRHLMRFDGESAKAADVHHIESIVSVSTSHHLANQEKEALKCAELCGA